MSSESKTSPFFSICVPQHNRTSFLKEAIRSYCEQSFNDLEICISDGLSTDGRIEELEQFLRETGFRYFLKRSATNLPYDRNLRSAIELATGRYIILMGNDDAFHGKNALEKLHSDILANDFPGVIISDYCDYRSGTRAFRIRKDEFCGSGARVAAMHFRNFSFVSGITMDRALSQSFRTEDWDGSEMYQTFIGSRIIASGQSLLEREHQLVRKDIVINGESVDSYATKPKLKPCPIVTRRIPLGQLGMVVSAAIKPYCTHREFKRNNLRIILQLIGLTYPGWLFQYRIVQSWNYAAGLALGMRPSLTAVMPLSIVGKMITWLVYVAVTLGGLFLPQGLFSMLRSYLYRFAKSVR
jgi:hypothetical protein